MQSILTNLISIFIALIPIIVVNYQFEVPKVFGFLLLSIVLIVFLLFNLKRVNFQKRDYYYLLWLLTLLVSGFVSDNLRTSILGGSYRHQGLIFFFGLFLLFKYVELLKQKQKNNLYKYIGITVLIQALLVIFGLKLATIGEINAVSGFLTIGIHFLILSFPSFILAVPIVAMMINFSKSGFLALLPYLFKKINSTLLLLVVILIFVVKPINNNSDYESRGVIWKYAVEIIKDKPVLGHGAESNEAQYDKKFLEDNIILTNLRIDRAHNLFLDVTIWSGLIGLYFFVMFLYESFKNLNFEKKQVFLSFLTYSMFQPLSVVHWILFALIL